ncbi:head decoration [Vibrio phage 11895-B1]|uniref:head decoration n=1 Tax=Vibrio phage 11895-B1 TaxID=754075 RepID=UPI0002C11F8A|nr:head decoration [Vibrio phage 11895-B1]AGH32201.1 hypothetical protein VPHG_00135 [Vibrio phage 11895-B1]
MATMSKAQAILARLHTEIGGGAYTHETIEFVKTATSANGSLLVAAGTEAAVADAALVVAILDCPEIDLYEVGDTIVTRKAVRGVVANYDVIQFSDAAYDGETLGLDASIVIQ